MRKRLLILAICIVVILLLAGCQKDSGMECSFADVDFSQVAKIQLYGTCGFEYTWITDPEDIDEIINFIKPITGTNGESSKGYYGSWYSLVMYDAQEQKLYSISFGVKDIIFTPAGSGMYGTRYEISDPAEEEMKAFFSQFESNEQ